MLTFSCGYLARGTCPCTPLNHSSVKLVHNESGTKPSAEPCPTFGPHPNTSAADFDFQQEVECLPFKLNLGDVPLDKEHQARFINLIYSNQEVFSLHDEDLCYCNKFFCHGQLQVSLHQVKRSEDITIMHHL